MLGCWGNIAHLGVPETQAVGEEFVAIFAKSDVTVKFGGQAVVKLAIGNAWRCFTIEQCGVAEIEYEKQNGAVNTDRKSGPNSPNNRTFRAAHRSKLQAMMGDGSSPASECQPERPPRSCARLRARAQFRG